MRTGPHEVVFGLTLDQRAIEFGAATVDDLLDSAVWAELSERFGAVFCGDSLLAKPRLESITLLSAIAARTKRVKLGTSCMASFPLRHPIWVAHQWATLDVISHGRTILAPCIGGGGARFSGSFESEFKAMGVSPATRVRRLEEGVEVIRRLWSEDHVSHHGEFWRFDDVSLRPKPAQPHPPIWIVSNAEGFTADPARLERPLRRAGRLGDGWQTGGAAPGTIRRNWNAIKRYAAEYGRDPERLDCCVQLTINVNDDEDAAYRETKRYVDLYYETDYPREGMPLFGVWGSVESCVRRLQDFIDEGVTYLTLRLATWDRRAQFEKVSEGVLPRLRAAASDSAPTRASRN